MPQENAKGAKGMPRRPEEIPSELQAEIKGKSGMSESRQRQPYASRSLGNILHHAQSPPDTRQCLRNA